MRIAHVVTLVSVDGAFGGPVAVARAQCEALAELGHDVTLFAGWDGRADVSIPGVSVRLFRARKLVPVPGFGGLTSLRLARALVKSLPTFDVVHFHLSRDLVVLPAALEWAASRRSFVVQTHGMVRVDHRLRARLLDALATRRVLRVAARQLVLTDDEEREAPLVARAAVDCVRVANGVPIARVSALWVADTLPEVIFCARLHRRKRPDEFVRMAAELTQRGFAARFTIAGPDEGELGELRGLIERLGVAAIVTYIGALQPETVTSRLAQAQVYVLPSVDEPFPMSVLEAMSVGLPCVITESTGISRALGQSGAVRVTDGHAGSMADAVISLLGNESAWASASLVARTEAQGTYSAAAVAIAIEAIYSSILTSTP